MKKPQINRSKRWRQRYPIRNLICRARGRAKLKGWEFDLTEEDITIPEYCPVLGIKLSWNGGIMNPARPSIDRIDSTKGYTKSNTIITSWRANDLKADSTPEELMKLAEFWNSYGK